MNAHNLRRGFRAPRMPGSLERRLIGRRITIAREKRFFSQEQAARLAGLSSRNVLCRIERGLRPLPLEEAVRICRVLQITLNQLVKGEA